MSQTVVVNNQNFTIPDNFDTGWGIILTNWIVVISQSTLQTSGGNFTLTADVNFGPNFGLLAKYFETIAANPAQSGEIRLAYSDFIAWRNSTNTADLDLGVDENNLLTFNGVELADSSSSQELVNKDIIYTPKTITDLVYTLILSDAFSVYLLFNNFAAQALVIPNDADVDIEIGTEIPISRTGTGTVQVAGAAGVTFQNPYNTAFLRVQFSSASIVKVDVNTWRIVGDVDNS